MASSFLQLINRWSSCSTTGIIEGYEDTSGLGPDLVVDLNHRGLFLAEIQLLQLCEYVSLTFSKRFFICLCCNNRCELGLLLAHLLFNSLESLSVVQLDLQPELIDQHKKLLLGRFY